MTKKVNSLSKTDDPPSWLARLKQFLATEPQDQNDLIHVLRDAKTRALIDADTLNMTEGVIQFSELRARDIMLPRNQMVTLHDEMTLEEVTAIVTESGHSRFPVFHAQTEEIIGILHAKDLLPYYGHPEIAFHIPDRVRATPYIPESMRLNILLREFRSHRNHMAIVVDEYGGVAGFVTIEDIIEQIIGDIEDEFDIDEEASIKKHDESHYIVKAHTPISDFNEALHATLSDDYHDTIGGVVMTAFGHLPERGEILTLEGLEFKVMNADARGIKLLSCIDKRHES
jgi:magnesium and cobalt transporter